MIEETTWIVGAEAPYAARNFAHLSVVSSRQRSYDRRRCENNWSLIVLFGIWLSCLKLKLETDGFVKNIEIDGGAVMNSLMVTYMWVQMGFPTGVCGVRSQHLHETKWLSEE